MKESGTASWGCTCHSGRDPRGGSLLATQETLKRLSRLYPSDTGSYHDQEEKREVEEQGTIEAEAGGLWPSRWVESVLAQVNSRITISQLDPSPLTDCGLPFPVVDLTNHFGMLASSKAVKRRNLQGPLDFLRKMGVTRYTEWTFPEPAEGQPRTQ